MMPSAPMAMAARASGGTMLRRPAAWLGSTITGNGKFIQHWDCGDVAGVPGGRFEGSYAALAEHDLRIAMRHDVLTRHEQFVDGGTETALQHHGAVALAQSLEQPEILHVARATCMMSA